MPYAIKKIEWRKIFDSAPDPIFLHDKDFRLILANRAYFECAGISEEEAIGKLYWEVFPKGSGPMKSCLNAIEGECNKEEGKKRFVYPMVEHFFLEVFASQMRLEAITTAVII